ncbi:unnamed protein product, partial [Prorocentrum cordatum]
MAGAAWGLGLPCKGQDAGFDFAVASNSALAHGRGARRGPGPAACTAEGVPCTRGPGEQRRSLLSDPSSRLHGASRQNVQVVIFDALANYALGQAACAGSGSRCVGVFLDRRSPRGIRVLEGVDMPCIPEDRPLAWCALEGIRCEEDCWTESARLVHLLAPRKASATGPGSSRQRQRLSCPPLLVYAKEALLRRWAADKKKKRRVVKFVVPVAFVADDDWVDGENSLSGMTRLQGNPVSEAAVQIERWVEDSFDTSKEHEFYRNGGRLERDLAEFADLSPADAEQLLRFFPASSIPWRKAMLFEPAEQGSDGPGQGDALRVVLTEAARTAFAAWKFGSRRSAPSTSSAGRGAGVRRSWVRGPCSGAPARAPPHVGPSGHRGKDPRTTCVHCSELVSPEGTHTATLASCSPCQGSWEGVVAAAGFA